MPNSRAVLLVMCVVVVGVVAYLSMTNTTNTTIDYIAPPEHYSLEEWEEWDEGELDKEINEYSAGNELDDLHHVLETRLKRYRGSLDKLDAVDCDRRGHWACFDARCKARFAPSSRERLRQLLSVREEIPAQYLQALKNTTSIIEPHKYILVTGASSNHYTEMQALLDGVFRNLLPQLSGLNYTFVVFNLGLKPHQRKLTEENCRCTVLDFPFRKMPQFMSKLDCYIWKPLVAYSLLDKAEYLTWFDASIRFTSSDPMMRLFRRAKMNGYQSLFDMGSIAVHTLPQTAAYFGDDICQYSPYGEMPTGFFILYNDRFTREAIMKPWISCAFNTTCMCSPLAKKKKNCRTGKRVHGRCHRYEQSSMGVILTRLYLEHRPMLTVNTVSNDIIAVWRGNTMTWFEDV